MVNSRGSQLVALLITYHTPLGYMSREKGGHGYRTDERQDPGNLERKAEAASHQAYERTDYGRRASGQNGDECADILMLLAAIRGGVNSLMAKILEDHIRLHITHPERGTVSNEELTGEVTGELTEDLIGLERAYLK